MINFDGRNHKYASVRNVVYGTKGMAASTQPLASSLGIEVMKNGGNAIDAAVAMAGLMPLIEPTGNGLGSDGFYLIWTGGKLYGLNASGFSPKALNADIVKENIACYATGSQIDHDVWLYGAGLVLRTNLLCDIYENQHCYLVGRKGNQLLSGEDSEMVMSMVVRGYKIFATDDVTFVHVLKAERLTEAYFYRLQEGLVLPAPVFETFRAVIDGRSFNGVLQKYYKSVKSILWSYLFFYKANAKEVRQWSKDCLKRYHFWGISTLWRIYKEWNEIKQSSQNDLSA